MGCFYKFALCEIIIIKQETNQRKKSRAECCFQARQKGLIGLIKLFLS